MTKKAFFKRLFLILLYPAGALLFLVVLFAIAYYSDFIPHNHYAKGDINDIIYAEPTQEAKDFDVEKYIDSLPSVEYKHIDYPIKETYTYEFNNYILTVDIPEGFKAYEFKLAGNPRVIDSTNIEDSCDRPGARSLCTGPKDGIFKGSTVFPDKLLCIGKNNNIGNNCNGDSIKISPYKSQYKGISLRDIYVNMLRYNEDKYIVRGVFFSGYCNNYNFSLGTLLSDQQGLGISTASFSSSFSRDLHLSILDSIKIRKK